MKKWKVFCVGLALAGFSSNLWAQVPTTTTTAATAATTAASSSGTLWSWLGCTKEQKEEKRRQCCKTAAGQMLNQMLMPLSIMTGGVIGNFCPTTPSAADLAKEGGEGVANKIKKDEAEAKARRAAARYLGTVDCHYWPEAEAALINYLRADRNECVRWEAAMALGRGCCCTKKTIEALTITATGSDKDGNPSETCERVKDAAFASLQHCLACFSQEVPAAPKKPEKPEAPKPEKPAADLGNDVNVIRVTGYYQKLDQKPMAQVVAEARQAVSEASFSEGGSASLPTGQRGMFNLISKAADYRVVTPKDDKEVVMESEPKPVSVGLKGGLMQRMQARKEKSSDASLRVFDRKMAQPEPLPMQGVMVAPVPEAKPMEVKPAAKAVEAKPAVKAVETKSEVMRGPMLSTPRPQSLPDRAPTAAPMTQSRAPQAPSTQQLLMTLQKAVIPFQREWAAQQLGNVEWRSHPEVVEGLLTTARKDANPSVKVMCIRSLARMKVDTMPVVTTIQAMQSDPDPRVEYEARQALAYLKGAPKAPTAAMPPAAPGTVQPVSMKPAGTPPVSLGNVQPAAGMSPVQPTGGAYRR